MNAQPGIAAVSARECRRIRSRRFYWLFLFVLPLASFALLGAIFQAQVPRQLPVALCDQDHSALSRELARRIAALPSLRLAAVDDPARGRDLILTGRAYALIEIPAGAQREVERGGTADIACLYNAQFILPGGVISRDLGQAVATVAVGLDLRRREGQGETAPAARAHAEPIRLDRHSLFNPQFNYVYCFLMALLPAMLQLFILIASVDALGSELKEKTAPDWLAAAGGSVWRAVLGKLLPHAACGIGLGLSMLVITFHWLAVPLQGSLGIVAAGTVLFVLAYQGVGLFLTAWSASLRAATSAAAVYGAPAFAFSGVTFPILAMPLAAKLWGGILPLTYYLRLLIGQALRGASPEAALPDGLALLAFATLLPLASLPRMGQVMRESRFWGRR